MKKYHIAALIAFTALACSPSVIVNEVLGQNATGTPAPSVTFIAQNATPRPSATNTRTSTALPTRTATATATAITSPAPALASQPTMTLREDLPGLNLFEFPRPANDNGRCIHFLPTGYYSPRDFDLQIPRMKDLQIRWTVALYSDENQLRFAAAQFKAAGITPIWRKSLRAYQTYLSWDRDIRIIREAGLPPYMQIYNEPDLTAEWDGADINREQWLGNFLQSAQIVYNSGGYVGMQVLDEEWLRVVLRTLKARQAERILGRMFFVPHPYGLNHPPNYVEDDNGVLGFRTYADVFQREIGFVPPFIAGEGGWKYKATDDNRFPIIADNLHAQYHAAVFRWFIDGKLSNGSALPDYLFAFCPWLLSGELEGAAWYDSFEGERTQTIQEVKKILPANAVRKFSWDKK